MIGSDISCPGCGVFLAEDNIGGYRSYCETCVEKIPHFPKAPAGAGFVLQGKYPDFYWEVSAPATLLTGAMPEPSVEVYDEDIPQ